MKQIFAILSILFFTTGSISSQTVIRVNQLGYTPNSIKIAVILSKEKFSLNEFKIVNALTDSTVFSSNEILEYQPWAGFDYSAQIDFSDFNKVGSFFIVASNVKSPIFRIDENIYNGSAEILLNYMRQQRCGYNPLLQDSCHTKDGFIIYHPYLDSTHIDVTGGWHDASDYLQYVTTSATATYQLLFAYQDNRNVFADDFNSIGEKKRNNIPDILDEAKWGLDWLEKMNPDDSIMFNQIADDRDHLGFRLPNNDSVFYGKGLERPVYFCTGKPQGIMKYKNRSDGIASTASKFASAFALASNIFKNYDEEYSEKLLMKARSAFSFAKNNPGVCQTAPCRAPYFYEEENYYDDLELAAIQLYITTHENKYLIDAINFGLMENVIPWMGSDTAKHYQWYPFINLGHYLLASQKKSQSEIFLKYLQEGLQRIYEKGKQNVFFMGVPFIWCSNNLVSAALTQLSLYKKISGDSKFDKMEAMLRDWLFGCNPWGTSMIIGFPAYADFPSDPHSAFTHLGKYKIDGGLVDGPVYASIYKKLLGITLHDKDEYENYQNDFIVYHDDYGDYSTNEPTMDGTASLAYYLSSLSTPISNKNQFIIDNSGIIGLNTPEKEIALIFSGHEFDDGADTIIKTLKQYNVKASFFFTGDFYRDRAKHDFIQRIKNDGHYLGAHSDKHILYCDWEKRDSLLITKDEFIRDLKNNYKELSRFGVSIESAKYFLPPYEWYNETISEWAEQLNIKIINLSPNTFTNADYTIPKMKNSYRNSEWILNKLIETEQNNTLNGKIILIHVGTHPDREDKFYNKLDFLLSYLIKKGYIFKRIDDFLE